MKGNAWEIKPVGWIIVILIVAYIIYRQIQKVESSASIMK